MRTTASGGARRAVCTLLIGALSFGAALAEAKSTARVSTTADWTTLQVTVAGAPPAYGSQGTIAYGAAGYADSALTEETTNVSGWGATTAQVSAYNVLGRGSASTTSIRAEGTGIADGLNNTYGRGVAYVYRIGYFPVSANGTIQASITFNLSQFFEYVPATDAANGYSTFNIGLGRVDPSTGITETVARTSEEFKHYSGSADINGTWTDQRTLSVSAAGEAGYTYAVDVFVQVDGNAGTTAIVQGAAPIPLSPLLPLLLTAVIAGTVALGRYRRR